MNRLRENNETVTIDGFTLGTDSSFVPTVDWVRSKLRVFNRTYFDNKLEVEQLKIKIYPYKGVSGRVRVGYQYNRRTGEIISYDIDHLGISTYFSRSELSFATTLLHEMIHLYQYEVLHRQDIVNGKMNCHGKTFTDKMGNINTHGWNIGVSETMEQALSRGAVNSKITQRAERKNDAKKYVTIFCIPERYYTSPLLPRDGVNFFVVKADEFLNKLGFLDDFVAPLEKERFICYWTDIKEDSEWYRLLTRWDMFAKKNRVSLNTFDKRQTSFHWDYSDWDAEQFNYVWSRMKGLNYEYFVNAYNDGEFDMRQTGNYYTEYSKFELPPEKRQKVTEGKKKPMTTKEFIDCLEADPFQTVVSVEENDDIVSVGAVLI